MNIKLIGGCGFIGTEVYTYLKDVHNVEVIDIAPSKKNIPYTFCDIVRNKESLFDKLKNTDIAYIFAAVSEASLNTSDPVKAVDVNIGGLNNVLSACVANKVKRVVFCSTCWVYSECNEIEVNENSIIDINAGTSIYSTTKISGEMLVRSYQRSFDLDYTILRFGTLYGENANPRTAVLTFLAKALNKERISIFSNSYRSFIHVSDLARAVANIPENFKTTKNETINIDGDKSYSLTNIVEFIAEKIPDVEVDINDSNIIEYKGKAVSIDKGRELLKLQQKVNLKTWIHNQIKI